MVIKQDPRKVLDLMSTRHREVDPDDEFLDRLAKKTSFYDLPKAPPEPLNLPNGAGAADPAAALDGLADVKLGDWDEEELAGGKVAPRVAAAAPAPANAAAAAEAARLKAEREKRELRFRSMFEGSSSGGSQQGSVPDNISFRRISAKAGQDPLPQVGSQLTAEQVAERAEQAKEDAARRLAWAELNRMRDEKGQASAAYRSAYERYVTTFGRRGLQEWE